MTTWYASAMECRNDTNGTEFKVIFTTKVHSVCTATCSGRFTCNFSCRDYECIVSFGDEISIAVVIIVTVADEDVLAFNIFFFCDVPCIAC